MTLSDLGQGYHLVPVRDHCRVTAQPRRYRECDWVALENLIDFNRTPTGWTKGAAKVWYKRYWAANWQTQTAMHHDFMEARVVQRARAARDRKARLARRKAECALAVCDPMALQVSAILIGVLEDLRTERGCEPNSAIWQEYLI